MISHRATLQESMQENKHTNKPKSSLMCHQAYLDVIWGIYNPNLDGPKAAFL